jgi:drug/metabolite transporter (DMT)-like permease
MGERVAEGFQDSGPHQHRLRGIALRVAAASCFALMAAAIKLAEDDGVSTLELVFYRFAFGLIPLLGWIGLRRDFGAWRTSRPMAHLGRACLGLVTMGLSFSALAYLPLAEATVMAFVAPLFAVMLSAIVLREPVGRHRWSAVAVGLAGVLLVMQPGGAALSHAGLTMSLVAALGVASVTITLRQIGRTERPNTVVLWFTLFSLAATGAAMPFFGHAHGTGQWLLLAAIGIFGGAGQLFMTASLKLAPVPVVVPFDYTQLIWAVTLGWLIWGTHPLPSTWIGAAVIVASGLYTVYREHKLGRDRPYPQPLEG